MRLTKFVLAFSFVLIFISGCASTTVVKGPVTARTRDVVQRHHIALWGFWEVSPPVDPNQLCGTGEWVKLNTKFNVPGIVLGVVTLGTYTPAIVTVTCLDAHSAK